MDPVHSLAATGLDGPIEWRNAAELDELGPGPADLAPAPHRENPAEMWHPEIVAAPTDDAVADEPEEVVDPEDLLLPSGRPTGFRFSTFSTGEHLQVDDGLTIPQPVGEPVIDEQVAWSPRSIALPGEVLAEGEPLPITFVPEGGTAYAPASAPALEPPTLEPPAPMATPSALDELVPVVPAVSQSVPVDDDGTVVLRAGILRLGPGVRSEVRHDSGRIRVELPTDWCWATLGHEADPVTISLPAGTLALDPGTTALVTVEPDDATFVAVASGHAVLAEAHGPTPLPAGSLALASVGSRAQVDHASAAEIDADPLVARNRELDAQL
ncbi:MAG: hypothetical protein R2746_11905 [Acidimicrobiales bacterium]